MADATAATRALRVLRALAAAPGPMTASALARDLQLPRSSTYHLLNAMESAGFVAHYAEDERWGLGVGAFEIGAAYLRHEPLEHFGRPVLHRLMRDVDSLAPAVAQINREMERLIRECPTQYLWGYGRYKQPREQPA